jgi:poly(ADP-ribose) glycohydrolase
MALVMLPCDLPWWDSVKKHLKRISNTKNTLELIEGMQKIHDICKYVLAIKTIKKNRNYHIFSVSLDPEEDTTDPDTFVGFLNFLDNDLTSEERSNFLNKTLPSIVKRALKLKENKPKDGLHFSLQQQPDCTELQYSFVSSLVANAFFSTFPKRSDKSHPTLQNFNFSHFFKHLHNNVQKSKLKSIFYYFDWIENNDNAKGCLKISRQVMTSKEWLTIEDWLECSLPLCPLQIKHEGKLERSEAESVQICFASSKIGGHVLSDGNTQECINLVTYPELLTVLLNVEALEDNEVLTVERIRHISRIVDPKNRACLEKLEVPQEMTICCVDADDYKKLPIGQYEEDNILRELNKCLLAFQQKQFQNNETSQNLHQNRQRRLSPIGESIGSTQSDPPVVPLITQQSCSTNRSGSPTSLCDNNNISNNKLRVQLEIEKNLQKKGQINNETLINNRRGRFIVLGSSGECLPVTRQPLESSKSIYSSCESSEEEFVSAKTSLDDGSEDENFHKRYSIDLETPERRHTFAQRLRDALRREVSDNFTSSEESSYAVGISVAGSDVQDRQIK